jgi:hypothetical protein
MNPDAIGQSPALPGTSPTDLNSAEAQQQAAEFDQLFVGMATAVMSVVIEDLIKVGNEDI